ncbi:hypothetical protein [Franzmannia qiaohouensis]|uniref:Uncharacterized protein n=1 Tax=Franzmannia qiaohouensis TaxID=1329370 RepID=A0ABU1HIU0_9GAMM|nr:hypothetical protein [Halomonas qiaohouensis]MDR5907393.1 hypothetical protein [Halomonas qiaohouensis]
MTATEWHPAALTLLREAVAELATPWLEEQSVKLGPGHWGAQRVLFSLPLARLSQSVLSDTLQTLLARWQMPTSDQQRVLSELAAAGGSAPHFLHLGLEGERRKVYWEYTLPESAPDPATRHVQYRAWKWTPGQDHAAVSEYLLLPSASAASAAIGDQLAVMPALVADIVEQLEISSALSQRAWPPMTVRIEEQQAGSTTPRDSLNLHMHQSRLPLGSVAGLLMALARDWQCAPRQRLVQWIAQHGDQLLGNVSFGVGAGQQPFFTCYYAGKRHSVPHDTLSHTR